MVEDKFQKAVSKQLQPVTKKEIDVKLDNMPKLTDVKKVDEFVPSKEEALGRIAMFLAKTEEEKILTDLDSRTVNLLTVLQGLAEYLNLGTYDKICKTYMRLRVSNKRLGRIELLEIAKAIREEPVTKLSRLRRFLGGIF